MIKIPPLGRRLARCFPSLNYGPGLGQARPILISVGTRHRSPFIYKCSPEKILRAIFQPKNLYPTTEEIKKNVWAQKLYNLKIFCLRRLSVTQVQFEIIQ